MWHARRGLVVMLAAFVSATLALFLIVAPYDAKHSRAAGFTRAPLALPLKTVGNGIFDSSGARVILGGIHRTGYQTATGDDIGDLEADSLAHWASMVRISTNGSLVADACNSGGAAYLNRLDNAVAQLTSRNIVALIDLHVSAPRSCAPARDIPLPGAAEATSFWSTISSRYASNPLVAFELYNEPHVVSYDQWANGGAVTTNGTGTYAAAGMQQLYDTITARTTSNLIFIDAPSYASDPKPITTGMLHVDTARTVWAMHVYTCPHSDDTACINNSANRTFPATKPPMGQWDSLSFSKPIQVTETGFPDPTDPTWFTGATQWSAKHTPAIGLIGYADDGSWQGSPFALTNGDPAWAPKPAGKPLFDYMGQVQPAQPGALPSPSAAASPSPSLSPTPSPSP